MEALAENEGNELGQLIEEISERVEKAAERRSRQLWQLVEDETMPEQAREGAKRAIENQVSALEKAYQAMENTRGLNRENADPEEYQQRAREHMPEELRERLPNAPASEGTTPNEGGGGMEETPDPGNTENEDTDAGEDTPGTEHRTEGGQPEGAKDDRENQGR